MDASMKEHYEFLLTIKHNVIADLREQLAYLEAEFNLLEKTYMEKTNNE